MTPKETRSFGEKPGAKELAAFQPTQVAGADEAAVPIDPLDLKPAAWHRRQALMICGLMTAFTLVIVVLLVFIAPHELPTNLRLRLSMWLVPAAVVIVLVTGWLGLRSTRRRLWLGQGRVEVRDAGKTLVSVPPDRLLASPRMLLVGHVILPYRVQDVGGRPGRWIYDEHLLRRYVLAHLGAAQRMTDADLMRAQMKRTPLWQWVLIALATAAVLGYLWSNGLLR